MHARQKRSHQLFLITCYVVLGLIIICIAGLVTLLIFSPTPRRMRNPSESIQREIDVQKQITSAKEKITQCIQQGHFALAVQHLDGVLPLLKRRPGESEEYNRLAKEREEIAVFADLLSESLEELLDHAIGLPEPEWRANFESRYRGKAIIFDTTVRREEKDRIVADYVLRVQGEDVRLDLNDVELFQRLTLEKPQRFLFGLRLQRIERISPGKWSVKFEPDSGVLLTNADAVAIVCPPLATPEVKAILDQQRKAPSSSQ